MRVPCRRRRKSHRWRCGQTPLTLWLKNELPGAADDLELSAEATVVARHALYRFLLMRIRLWWATNRCCLPAQQSTRLGRRDRAAAASTLLQAHPEVDMLVCDDGLQHYGLARDSKLPSSMPEVQAMVGFPGRASAGAAWQAAAVGRGHLQRNSSSGSRPMGRSDPELRHGFASRAIPGNWAQLGGDLRCGRSWGQRLFALAGIGHPPRFFQTLSELGLDFERRPFPITIVLRRQISRFHTGILLLTEKDAVKCPPTLATEALGAACRGRDFPRTRRTHLGEDSWTLGFLTSWFALYARAILEYRKSARNLFAKPCRLAYPVRDDIP